MSDEPTKDIGEKYTTQPTIQTVLERIDAFQSAMERRFDGVESRLTSLERKVDILNKDLLSIRADLAGMDERVRALETE